MTAYEESMAELVERVTALEVKLQVRDRVDEIHADSLKHVIDKFDERVETLESRAHGVMDRLREFDGYVERLEELEKAAEVADLRLRSLENGDAGYEEQNRHDRWHATRDAALTGLLAKDACSGCHNDEFIRAATVFADRAHGPLESKAADQTWMKTPHGICNHEGIGLPGCKLCDPLTKELVSVVHDAADFLAEGAADERDVAEGLREAIKPFEAQK